jgi:4-alpha-glucanotransferase
MRFSRRGGILAHPTSFPGPYGIGDLGPEAYRFIDFLIAARQALWQILPLGPTGYGDSPYQAFSAFAGNPLLVSPDRLVEQGFLAASDLEDLPALPADRVDYGWVIQTKERLLRTAFERFGTGAMAEQHLAYEAFEESLVYGPQGAIQGHRRRRLEPLA